MECGQNIIGARVSLPLRLTAGFIGALLINGCADSGPTPDVISASPESDPVTVSPIEDTMENPSAELTTIDQPDEAMYPSDHEGNDPVGMIVTGFEEQDPSHVVSPWLVSVRVFRSASGASNTGDVSVELTRYADDFPVSAHIGFYTEPLDTCVIRNSENEAGVDLSNPPPAGIDGGENVVLNSPSGPWLRLERIQTTDESLGYRGRNRLPDSLPVSTTLSIPGGAFPTVGAYSLFEPVSVVRLLPVASQPVTAESVFRWETLDKPGHIKIDFLAYDEAGNFQSFPASCWVVDDGSFDIPGEVQESLETIELQHGSGSRLSVRYSRIYSRLDVIDGVVLYQGMEVAE